MLRPKKKITKKQIQRDPFLETVDQAQAHLEENRSRYLQIGIVILAILIGINVLSNNSQNANKEASSSLGDALLTLDLNDQTTAKFQLETVINEYENTTSASLAEYYLGKIVDLNIIMVKELSDLLLSIQPVTNQNENVSIGSLLKDPAFQLN